MNLYTNAVITREQSTAKALAKNYHHLVRSDLSALKLDLEVILQQLVQLHTGHIAIERDLQTLLLSLPEQQSEQEFL